MTSAGGVVRIRRLISTRFLWQHAGSLGRVLQLAAVVLLGQSLFWTARVPIVLKLATAALAALAYVRPGSALVAVTGLVPFTYVVTTQVWHVHPLALGEALVLAFLAGYLLRSWRWRDTGRTRRDALSTPACVLALVVLASCAVQFTIVRVWHDYPLAYTWTFLTYLARDYLTTVPDPRPWGQGQSFMMTAALLLEGIAVLLATRTLCRTEPGLGLRLLRTAIVAGAGAAALNLSEIAEVALRGESLVGRWTLFIPSLNTAGAYFVLVAFVATGLGAASPRSRSRALFFGAAAIAAVAMWLTGTRSARVAYLAVAVAGAVWLATVRSGPSKSRRAALIAAVAALAVGVTTIASNPAIVLSPGALRSVEWRVTLAGSALQVLRTHPLAGVGIGQYVLNYQRVGAPDVTQTLPTARPHNNFLWVAAELGLVGVGLFMWLLGAALGLSWRRLRAVPTDLRHTGLCAGLVAFIATWLSWQPLEVPVVAYTFWILLGVAAYADGGHKVPDRPEEGTGTRQLWRRAAVAALVVLVVISVPIRARQAIGDIDFSRVAYGFHLWETEGPGTRYRWTGSRATFFVRSSVRAIDLPLRAFDPVSLETEAFEVRILVNRRRVGLARLTDDRWHRFWLPAPGVVENERFWRVDLEVNPTWRPAEWLPPSTDSRTLGVKVGEIRLWETPGQPAP